MTSLDPTDPAAPIDAIGPHTVELLPWRRRLIRVGDGPASRFQQQPLDGQAATVFFAVIDLVAGVALWLGSTWGAMLWLLTAAAQVLADVVVLELSGFSVMLTIVEVVLVAGYVIIRFLVHSESGK
jgi:uncharacterized membrane protein (DUF2068 family)